MPNAHDIEAKRLIEQQKLDALRTPEHRNRFGQFATPVTLALDIARYARREWSSRSRPVRFLDPAIGTGAFYSALRHVFRPGEVAAATGVELDKAFAETASRLWKGTGLRITRGDFTAIEAPKNERKFSLVLTNPPYVRHHHLTRSDKQRLQRAVANTLGIRISGLAGLYSYFLLLAD